MLKSVQTLHDNTQRVGAFDSGWDFSIAKLFYNIRYSEMCKNHNFFGMKMRKVVCGHVDEIKVISKKILQSG